MTTEELKPETETKSKLSDTEAILEAVKELTKTVAEMAKQVNTMNETHTKWVKAGKF